MIPTAEALFHHPERARDLPYAILIVGKEGEVLHFNGRVPEILGRVPEPHRERYYGLCRRFSADGTPMSAHQTPGARALQYGEITRDLTVRVERHDGHEVACQGSMFPVRNYDGEVLGAVAIFRPLSECPAPVAEEDLTAEDLPTLISYVASDYRYRFANGAYQQWFGLSEKDIVGRTVAEVLGPDSARTVTPELSRALAGEAVEAERYLPSVRGRARFLQVRYVPDRGPAGIIRGTAVIGTDVTHLRMREIEEKSERKKAREGLLGRRLKSLDMESRFVPPTAFEMPLGDVRRPGGGVVYARRSASYRVGAS